MKNSLIKYFKTYYPYLLTILIVIAGLQQRHQDDKFLIKYEFGNILNDIKDEFRLQAKIENEKNKEFRINKFTNSKERIYRLSKWDITLRGLDINNKSINGYSDEEFLKIIQAFKSDIRIKNLLDKYHINNNNFKYNFPLKSFPLIFASSLFFTVILILLFSTVSFLNKNWTLIRTMKKTSVIFIIIFLIQIIINFI